ncbi:MAG: hypothetical protein IPO27_14265 [Bacteroidetes bacterium]|nr:hypothetical protein [Bacteroidota bacterium]
MKRTTLLVGIVAFTVYATLAGLSYFYSNNIAGQVCAIIKIFFLFLILKEIVLEKNSFYRAMLMVSISVFLIGLLFKVQHWPMAAEMITVSLFSICIFVIPFYLKRKENPMPRISKTVFVISFLVSILFKLLHFPFSTHISLINEVIFLGGIVAFILSPPGTDGQKESGLLK